jgi:adenine-specific DNA-methyltransferase
MIKEESSQEKLVRLLKDLFQFDVSELDFGIYRILNHKRDVIERFIEKDLIERADLVFKEYAGDSARSLKKELDALKAEINETIEAGTIDEHGKVTKHDDIKKVKEYLKKQEEFQNAQLAQGTVEDVYNQIYEFFSRYYDQGDFFSKPRRGGRDKYAVPYNGEEVMLHWANKDQYYIKSGEYFTNYEFRAGAWGIKFILVHAEIDPNNIKGEKRYFILAEQKPELDTDAKEFRVFFNYRGLTEDEERLIKARDKQAELTARAQETILSSATLPELKQSLTKKVKVGENEKSLLEKNLSTYIAKNTTDYFIHKNLKGFLESELDFYIKNEVLLLDEITGMKETALRQMMAQVKAIREIGHTIIEFLAQIEDFQRMLWEKKKFVLRADYCMTLDLVPKEFYEEIGKNKLQVAEWKRLFALDEMTEETLFQTKGQDILKTDFLESHRHLVLDTKFFDQDFTDRLIAEFNNLNEMVGGLIIKSDNWQGLNLICNRYQKQVKCVYIDPPFNSKTTEILYKNEYKHSSWLSLIFDRIYKCQEFLQPEGVFICAIDENEQERLGFLLNRLFPEFEKTCVSIIHNPGGIQGDNFSYCHEFAYFIYPKGGRYINLEKRDENADIRPLRDVSKGDHLRVDAANCFYPILVKDGKIIDFGDVCEDSFHPTSANVLRNDGIMEIYPVDAKGNERKWVFARKTVESIKDELTIEYNKRRNIWDIIRTKKRINFKTVWTDRKYNSNIYGSKLLNNMMGEVAFSFPKSLYNVSDCIDSTTKVQNNDLILDYFAGSGTTAHAILNLNAEDDGNRKYILVEMGDYFDTVMKPRIQKVMFSREWKDGKPVSKEGHSHMFKYMYLEQYEDTLNNIVFQARDKTSQETLDTFKDYFVRYMLEYETRDSPARLAVKEFEDPFNYKLWIERSGVREAQNVDLVETFNYLLGLEVDRILTAKDGRYYRAVYGKKRDGKTVLIVWRSVKGIDLQRDRDFIEETFLKDGKPDLLYVNSQCYVKDAVPIEPDFKRLMGA